jgi:hypothetical protein
MEGALDVVRLFCRDLSRQITIRQISKLIKKSYGYTNSLVWKLIESNVLNKVEIGNSLVCSLNLSNEKARTLLVIGSLLDMNSKGKEEIVNSLKQNDALFAFYFSKKLVVVCSDDSRKNDLRKELGKAEVLSKAEFIVFLKQKNLDNSLIYGAEKYWEIVGDNYGK